MPTPADVVSSAQTLATQSAGSNPAATLSGSQPATSDQDLLADSTSPTGSAGDVVMPVSLLGTRLIRKRRQKNKKSNWDL